MGPGSENIMNIHHYQHQHLANVVLPTKGNKKAHGKSNPSPSWFYDQMKGTVSAYENGKAANHRQPIKSANKKSSSPQQFHAKASKPAGPKRSFSQNEAVASSNQGKAFVAPDQRNSYGGGRQHQSNRNSPVKGAPFATPPRQSSVTPPTVYSHSQSSSPKPILQGGKPFYAGARFESHPSHMVLPTPPSHWTAPLQRSQSQPSSPTLKSMQAGVGSAAVDLTSLFGSLNSGTLAKSFPGEHMMQALMRAEEKKKEAKLALKSKDVSSDEESANEANGSEGEESKDAVRKEAPSVTNNPDADKLKAALQLLTIGTTVVVTPPTPKTPTAGGTLDLTCHASVTPKKSYSEMSAQLKFLMNVAA